MTIPRYILAATLPLLLSTGAVQCQLPDGSLHDWATMYIGQGRPAPGERIPARAAQDAVHDHAAHSAPTPDPRAAALAEAHGASTWENPNWRPGAPLASNAPTPQNRTRAPVESEHLAGERGPGSADGRKDMSATAAMQDNAIPVLCYHQIEAGDRSYGGFNVSPERFEEQLRYLRDAGYESISQAQLIDLLAGRARPGRNGVPARGVLLTFDDGLISHYRTAAPLLKRYGFRGVLFLYPTVISSNKRAAYMNWSQARELVESGVFEVGSHSLYHPFLPELSPQELTAQMRQSRKILERKLAAPIRSFAYPFGIYDREVIAAARAAGYELAFTINTGGVRVPLAGPAADDHLTLNRYMVTRGDNLKRFRANLQLKAPGRIEISPPDGSRVGPGASFRLVLPGVRADSVRVRLGKRDLELQSRDSVFVGRLPEFRSSRGYLPLEVRAKTHDGQRLYRRFLYLDAAKF